MFKVVTFPNYINHDVFSINSYVLLHCSWMSEWQCTNITNFLDQSEYLISAHKVVKYIWEWGTFLRSFSPFMHRIFSPIFIPYATLGSFPIKNRKSHFCFYFTCSVLFPFVYTTEGNQLLCQASYMRNALFNQVKFILYPSQL